MRVRDGFFHADMHQGNLFVDAAGRLVAVDFGIMGRLGLKERRFLAEILYGFITRDYRRVAEVHFEAGYVPRVPQGRGFRAGDPRHRRADPCAHRRPDLDGEAADAAVRDDGAVRHDDAHGTRAVAKDHGRGRRRRAHGSTPSSTCGRRPSRSSRGWIEREPRAGRADRGCAARRSRRSAQFAGNLPGRPAATRERSLSQVESMAENGFELSEDARRKLGAARRRAAPGWAISHFGSLVIMIALSFIAALRRGAGTKLTAWLS